MITTTTDPTATTEHLVLTTERITQAASLISPSLQPCSDDDKSAFDAVLSTLKWLNRELSQAISACEAERRPKLRVLPKPAPKPAPPQKDWGCDDTVNDIKIESLF